MNWLPSHSMERMGELLRETTPPPEQIAFRLQAVERDIVLPVKAVFIGILLYYLYFSRWFEDVALPQSVAQQTIEQFFLIYLVLNVGVALVLIFSSKTFSPFIQGVIFTNSFVDGLFLAALTFVTGGFDSILYWIFLGLIVRNAISVPLAFPQIFLNLMVSFCYLLAGVMDVVIQNDILDLGTGVNEPDLVNPTEPFLLRLIVLWLMTICCYGVQILLERHRQAQEEAQEFSSRQMQLHSAGRLAAEIAHQLKNPLGIINNAAFSLQRSAQSGKVPSTEQILIIREEVERSDRILTKLMGYAQLAESHVERLDVSREVDRAVAQVVPAGGPFTMEVERNFQAHLPPLLMQRGHFSEIIINLLLNAREAMNGKGLVKIRVYSSKDHAVHIEISDSGPGIDPEHVRKIFNSYFSTKAKGTGLGLAIVKNNVEMYSGTVHVDSELGKGTTFRLRFPTRTLMREFK